MAKRKPAKPAKAAKKAAPRTKGTPAKRPKPRKVAAPRPKAPAKRAAKHPAPRPPSVPRLPPARPAAPRAPAWMPAPDPAPQWRPAPDPPAARAPAPVAFDPATGTWLQASAGTAVAGPDPAAYRRGATRSILLNILLGIDLALLALNFILGIAVGLILVFAPDSSTAQRFQESSINSPTALALEALLMFVLAGVIPFFWVLGTRVGGWPGAKKFLQLRFGWAELGWGVLLVPVMLVAVIVLAAAYTCAVDGCSALTDTFDSDDTDNGVDVILDNLNWPVAVMVALGAGIGEEILFRGVLRRPLGVWGQAIAFGLAHAGNGYPPQVLFAFGLGLGFGFLAKRGWSLVSLMVAHALYDFTLLALALIDPNLG